MDAQTLADLRKDRIVDITTTGRKSGQPRRIEIVLVALNDGGFLLSGSPTRARSWFANLQAHPDFTVHLKRSRTADLPARAFVVTDEQERRTLTQQMHDSDPERGKAMTEMEQWVAKSPLVKVEFV